MGGRDKERPEERYGGRPQFKKERGPHQHVLVISPRGEKKLVTTDKAERLIQEKGWLLGTRKD